MSLSGLPGTAPFSRSDSGYVPQSCVAASAEQCRSSHQAALAEQERVMPTASHLDGMVPVAPTASLVGVLDGSHRPSPTVQPVFPAYAMPSAASLAPGAAVAATPPMSMALVPGSLPPGVGPPPTDGSNRSAPAQLDYGRQPTPPKYAPSLDADGKPTPGGSLASRPGGSLAQLPQSTMSAQPPQSMILEQPPQSMVLAQPPQSTVLAQPPQSTVLAQPPQSTAPRTMPIFGPGPGPSQVLAMPPTAPAVQTIMLGAPGSMGPGSFPYRGSIERLPPPAPAAPVSGWTRESLAPPSMPVPQSSRSQPAPTVPGTLPVSQPMQPPPSVQFQGPVPTDPKLMDPLPPPQSGPAPDAPPLPAPASARNEQLEQVERNNARLLMCEDDELQLMRMERQILQRREGQIMERLQMLEHLANDIVSNEEMALFADLTKSNEDGSYGDRNFTAQYTSIEAIEDSNVYINKDKIRMREKQLKNAVDRKEDHPWMYLLSGRTHDALFERKQAIHDKIWRQAPCFQDVDFGKRPGEF